MSGFKDLSVFSPRAIEKGWVTIWDLTEEWGIGYDGAAKRAYRLFRQKKLERRPHPNPAGIGSPVFIYRPK